MNRKFLSRFRIRFAEPAFEAAPTSSTRPEGNFLRIWAWVLPVMLGGMLGWFGMVCVEIGLNHFAHSGPPTFPAALTFDKPQENKTDMAAFLKSNPFRVTPQAEKIEPNPSPYLAVASLLASATLRWTMPDVGAYMEAKGNDRLILVGGAFDGYTLEKVSYLQAVFSKGEERVVKDLIYLRNDPPEPVPAPGPSPAPHGGKFSVIAATPGGQEGVIPQEIMVKLLEDPFQQLNNVRLRPGGDGGMQVHWINKDSILNQLGIKKGDTIRGLNGISLKNTADIANSMESLRQSDRFDILIFREGRETTLRYVVR